MKIYSFLIKNYISIHKYEIWGYEIIKKKINGKLMNLKDVQLWFKNADSVI